ncbi:lysophospholipase [Mycena rosella]|uniref:Lysophospholipase n=1 Tax=Mycena rosella TaxID=1033263 RepID=A0AAD7GLD4_MYCRO|nr:lysophospholipase [Mycena rosella]
MLGFLTVVLLLLAGPASAAVGPSIQRCPADFELVRRGQGISVSEARYIEQKREKVLPSAFKTYLHNVQRTGVTLPDYVEKILQSTNQLPTVGISTSGGGFRAAIFGAGVLNALDARNSSSVEKGTGGLLQAATHLAGLSGGSWLVTSLAQANFPTIQHLVFGDGRGGDFGGWIPEFDIWTVSTDPAVQATYVDELLQEIAVKAKHFPVSVGDGWGRALARHFSNGTSAANFLANTSHGAGILFSDLINLPTLASHELPFPIITADLLSKHINGTIFPGGNFVPLNTPMFEFNIFEMGCFDDVLAAHTPTKHLGTTNSSVCVTGFDEAMFLSGTSSNLWNELNITAEILAENTANFSILVNETYPQSPALRLDTSNFPNPFHGVAPQTFADAGETILVLCDGGEDGQVSPLQPMLVKDRKIDVILAIDAVRTDDADGFAGGASLIATQDRMQLFQSGLATFPSVPTTLAAFAAANLSSRPTFFGCTPDFVHARWGTPPAQGPLLVYIANGAPPRDGAPPLTNTSTFQSVYSAPEMQGMLMQTFVTATQGAVVGDALEDPEWGACLACAVVDRARAREGVSRSGVCTTCFARYCWEG